MICDGIFLPRNSIEKSLSATLGGAQSINLITKFGYSRNLFISVIFLSRFV